LSLVSERLKVVRPSQTEVMTARAAELRDQDADVITLSQGEPDFDTPAAICEAGIRAIRDGQTKYTAVAGIKPLREAIRESLRRDQGLGLTTVLTRSRWAAALSRLRSTHYSPASIRATRL
jgi:aspartate aminotransferase